MSERLMAVDEQVFRAHLEAGPFQSGVDRGRWRLLSLQWPYALIAVQAAEHGRRSNGVCAAVRMHKLPSHGTDSPAMGRCD